MRTVHHHRHCVVLPKNLHLNSNIAALTKIDTLNTTHCHVRVKLRVLIKDVEVECVNLSRLWEKPCQLGNKAARCLCPAISNWLLHLSAATAVKQLFLYILYIVSTILVHATLNSLAILLDTKHNSIPHRVSAATAALTQG